MLDFRLYAPLHIIQDNKSGTSWVAEESGLPVIIGATIFILLKAKESLDTFGRTGVPLTVLWTARK